MRFKVMPPCSRRHPARLARVAAACAGVLLAWICGPLRVRAQSEPAGPDAPHAPVITATSSLVLVPALVKTKAGDLVFSLQANDFTLTDDGVPQPLRLEVDTDSQPLALVVLVQTGSLGAAHLEDYRGLQATLEAIIGGVRHKVALVAFDSEPHLEQAFTPDTQQVTDSLGELEPGDQDAAILDGLRFATDLLRKQPALYRRAVLMFTETVDRGSQTDLDEVLRAVDDTNTAIYSFAFSSARAAAKHQADKLPVPNHRTVYSSTPYKAGGCMSREPDADPDAHGSRKMQALDCAEDLLPPLRVARLAFVAARESLKRNVPETVAQLTGGEYFPFKNRKTLASGLVMISNDVPNRYVLSFAPSAPHPGLHTLALQLKDRPGVELKARNAYWVDGAGAGP